MKKFILSLFVGFISLISFCSADTVSNLLVPISEGNFTAEGQTTSRLYHVSYSDYGVYCISVSNWNANGNIYNYLSFGYNNNLTLPQGGMYLNIYRDQVPATVCFKVNQPNILVDNFYSYSITFDYVLYRLDLLLDEDLPVMSSSECQFEYNLIPIESVDTNYCVENELCPVNECIGSGSWSNVYINDILHPGEENIFVNIPDYIQWDYSISSGDFNIYVGSGYDMDYMNSIIKINSYRPDSTDFTDIFVSGLTLIFPYIFVVLLLMFIWKLLRRIFK